LLGTLHKRGKSFEVVSTRTSIKDELTFEPNTLERTVYDVDPGEASNDFRGIAIVSGNMADTEAYWTDPHILKLLNLFQYRDRIKAAICCSVPTLAPIAQGVRVSFFPLVRSRDRLLRYGAIPQTVSLTVDAKVITAENQMVTQMWAEEIVASLEGRPPVFQLTDSGYTPKGRPRRLPQDLQDSIDKAKASRAMKNV
jgi:putative intracellular protease/amidase